jgi:hypothetical protein
MPNLNTTNLQGVLANLQTRVPLLAAKTGAHQAELDPIVNELVTVDGKLAAITLEQDGPRTDIDFTNLSNAIAAFMQSPKISQNDANALAGLIQRNTA